MNEKWGKGKAASQIINKRNENERENLYRIELSSLSKLSSISAFSCCLMLKWKKKSPNQLFKWNAETRHQHSCINIRTILRLAPEQNRLHPFVEMAMFVMTKLTMRMKYDAVEQTMKMLMLGEASNEKLMKKLAGMMSSQICFVMIWHLAAAKQQMSFSKMMEQKRNMVWITHR